MCLRVNMNVPRMVALHCCTAEEQVKLLQQQIIDAQLHGVQLVNDMLCGTTKLDIQQLGMQLLNHDEMKELSKVSTMSSVGAKASDVSCMEYQSQRRLIRISELLVFGLLRKLKAGIPDPGGALKLLSERSAVFKEILTSSVTNDALDHPVVTELANSIITHTQLGQRSIARQLLSILVAALPNMDVTYAQLSAKLTHHAHLEPGW